MYICDELKLLYIHIPKCAGALVYSLMQPKGVRTLGETHDRFTEELFLKYQHYHKFVIVRNSWEMFASSYRFSVMNFGYHQSFKKYINETYKNKIQLEYFCHPQHGKMVNEIIEYEYREEFLKEMFKVPGLPRTDREHYYGPYDWRKYYENETINLVGKYCHDDIRYFKFKFKEGGK
jgi:hypothetical protein